MNSAETEALIKKHVTMGIPLPIVNMDDARVLPFNYAEDGRHYATFTISPGSDAYTRHPSRDMAYHLGRFKSSIGPIPSDVEAVINALAEDGWEFLVMLRRSWRRSVAMGSIELIRPGDTPLFMDIHIGHPPKIDTPDTEEQ